MIADLFLTIMALISIRLDFAMEINIKADPNIPQCLDRKHDRTVWEYHGEHGQDGKKNEERNTDPQDASPVYS